MQAILLIGAGGAMGAVLRYTVSLAVHRVLGVSFPWGTLAVNVAGCLFIGIAWAGIEELDMPAAPRLFLITGILGAFTTFSTFGLETINLLREGEVVLGVANVAGSTAAGLVAVVVGMIAGRALFSL